MKITHNEAVEIYKKLIDYCRNRECSNCVFNGGKCFLPDFHFMNDITDVENAAKKLEKGENNV